MGKKIETILSRLPLNDQEKDHMRSLVHGPFETLHDRNVYDSVQSVLHILILGGDNERVDALKLLRLLFVDPPDLDADSIQFYRSHPDLLAEEVSHYKRIADTTSTKTFKTQRDSEYKRGLRKHAAVERSAESYRGATYAVEIVNELGWIVSSPIRGLSQLHDARTKENLALSVFCYRHCFPFKPVSEIFRSWKHKQKNRTVQEAENVIESFEEEFGPLPEEVVRKIAPK